MNKTIEEQKLDALKLVNRLLDPEDLGHAVSAEVRDEAREVLGMERVETCKQ
jgi:hypothetical protein